MITRNKLKRNFTIIPNEIITDERISKGALQLYLYISSKPDNWNINNRDIKKNLKIGSDNTLAKYWKELINSFWITRKKYINDKGQFTGCYDYTINTEFAKSDNSDIPNSQKNRIRKKTEFAKSDSYNNTDLLNNTKSINKKKKFQKTKLSKDFSLKEETIKKLKEEGYGQEQINKTMLSFKDYWIEGNGKGKKQVNWQTAFKIWIRKAKPWRQNYSNKTDDLLNEATIWAKEQKERNKNG